MSLGASFEGVSDEPFRVAEVVSEIAGTFADRSSGVAADHEVGLDVLDDGRAGVISGDILRSKALAFLVEHATQHDPAPDDASEPKE